MQQRHLVMQEIKERIERKRIVLHKCKYLFSNGILHHYILIYLLSKYAHNFNEPLHTPNSHAYFSSFPVDNSMTCWKYSKLEARAQTQTIYFLEIMLIEVTTLWKQYPRLILQYFPKNISMTAYTYLCLFA